MPDPNPGMGWHKNLINMSLGRGLLANKMLAKFLRILIVISQSAMTEKMTPSGLKFLKLSSVELLVFTQYLWMNSEISFS
jgi:hypothetical protein